MNFVHDTVNPKYKYEIHVKFITSTLQEEDFKNDNILIIRIPNLNLERKKNRICRIHHVSMLQIDTFSPPLALRPFLIGHETRN